MLILRFHSIVLQLRAGHLDCLVLHAHVGFLLARPRLQPVVDLDNLHDFLWYDNTHHLPLFPSSPMDVGLLMSKYDSVTALQRLFFKSLKAFSCSSFHAHSWLMYVRRLSGSLIAAAYE